MYLLIDDRRIFSFPTLDAMAAAEHELAPLLVGEVFRMYRAEFGARMLCDWEVFRYRFLLDEAVGMWDGSVLFEPTTAGIEYLASARRS